MEFFGVKAFFCSYLHCRDCPEDSCPKGSASPSLCDLLCDGNDPGNDRVILICLPNTKASRYKKFISDPNI